MKKCDLPRSSNELHLQCYPGVVLSSKEMRGVLNGFGQRKVVVEVGCADGELLVAVAGRSAGVGFVGIDWKCKAIVDAAERVVGAGLTNVVLARWRAQDLGEVFAEGEVDEVWVFHPEPCDREKELANRLVSRGFLGGIWRLLKVGGKVVLKTDHRGYFEWVLGEVEGMAGYTEVGRSWDYWNDAGALAATAGALWAGEVTRYEGRFRGRGKAIHYMELERRG